MLFKKKPDNEAVLVANGGAASKKSQLYYKGKPLPMENTVAQLCVRYPEIREKLGGWYILTSGKTLNQLCDAYGAEKMQSIIDKNS